MPYKFKGKRDCTQSDGSKGKYQTVKKDGSKRCYKTEKQYKAAQAYAHETEEDDDIITEVLREYIRESLMYHSTDPKNIDAIQQAGLQIGRESVHTTAGAWADEFYGTRPVYVSVQKGKYEGQPLAIDTSGLDLVADLPGLVDTGAYQEEEGMYWDEGAEPPEMLDFVDDGGMVYFDDLLSPGHPIAMAAIELTGTAAVLEDIPPERIQLESFRKYIRALLKEDPMGFVQDLAAASDEFGDPDYFGEMFFGGHPGKGGGKAIKRAFNANADHAWLATLNTVHWKDPYILDQLQNSSKDELSTSMSLPGDNLMKSSFGNVGLWIKGRITLATNDQDNLFSGGERDYRPKSDADQEELTKYLHKKDSSGINKLPKVSKDYSMYGNLKPGNEYSEKLARNIPYVLDQSTWDPSQTRSSTNEALVDNWRAVGIVAGKDDLAKSVKAMANRDWAIDAAGITRKIFMLARDYGVPIYDVNRTKLWSPK